MGNLKYGDPLRKEERIPRLKDFLPSRELELVRDSGPTLSARFSASSNFLRAWLSRSRSSHR